MTRVYRKGGEKGGRNGHNDEGISREGRRGIDYGPSHIEERQMHPVFPETYYTFTSP